MSQKIRQGNDIDIHWSLLDADENPYILEGRNIEIELEVGKKRVKIRDILDVNQNTVHFVYYGKDQKYLGSYNLKFIENNGEVDMVTFDTRDAFTMVEHSWLAIDEGETPETIQLEFVTISSNIHSSVGPRGLPAGFGEITVSVDDTVGTPSADVIATGPDTAKNFHFEFSGLKGEPGIGNITAEDLPGTAPLLVNPSNYWTKAESDARYLGGGGTVTVDDALSTTSENPVQNKVITNALNGKQGTIDDLAAIRSGASAGATAYQKPVSGIPASDLASGVIPDVSGFYTKPGTGIPATDLAAAVQTSLGKADSALQSFTETDPTVPSWAKQPSKPTYTAQEVGALPAGTPIPSDLDDLSDVDGTTPTDGQVLAWNATASKWKPTTMQGGGSVTVDSVLSDTSENPVQNKVVKAAVDAKQDVIDSTNKLPYAYLSGTPTIPVVPTNVSAFTNDAGYLTSQNITGKADKVSSPTSGNFAGLDANGNLTDSGSKASDFATAAQGAKADTAYQKPSGGIPASDLASGVIPTVPVTDVTVGGTSVVSNGTAVIPAIPDVTGKQDYKTVQAGQLNPYTNPKAGDVLHYTDNVLASGMSEVTAYNYYDKADLNGSHLCLKITDLNGVYFGDYGTVTITFDVYYTYIIGYNSSGLVVCDSNFNPLQQLGYNQSYLIPLTQNTLDTQVHITDNATGNQRSIINDGGLGLGIVYPEKALQYDGHNWIDIKVVPTTLSELSDDSTHRLVSDTEKSTWNGKQDKSTITSSADATGSITLADNTEFRFTNAALTSLTIALPASIGDRLDAWISFNSGSTATSATYPNTIKWSGDDVNNNVFVPAASKTYNIGIWYDGINVNAVARSV